MATKKTGVLVGIAAIAVIGVAAVLYFSQWPPAEEDATGAIGAAERYRAEQITDEDVILDIPGQEQLAETVFEVLTEEQKAELLGRALGSERGIDFEKFEVNEAVFERWSPRQKAGFARVLDNAARAELAAAMRFNAKDFDAMRAEIVAEKFSGLNVAARKSAFERFEANEEAFQRWSVAQRASFARVLDHAARAELAAAMRFNAKDFDAMRAEIVAEKFSGLNVAARKSAFERFEANEEAFQRWSVHQRAGFSYVLGAKGLEQALLRRGTFDRLTQAQQRTVWSRLGSDGQFAALRYGGLEADLARGDSLQRGEQFERMLAERRARE
jgi:stress-induced morphogen